VVGVAPPEFAGIYAPLRIDLWVPFRYRAGNDAENRRGIVLSANGFVRSAREQPSSATVMATPCF
jgi:hypothetical protein